MKLTKTILYSMMFSLFIHNCEQLGSQPDEIKKNPLIGQWEYNKGGTTVVLISSINQQVIDHSKAIEGNISLDGSDEGMLRYLSHDIKFMTNDPHYVLSEKPLWDKPSKYLRLYDTSGVKTGEYYNHSDTFYADSIDFNYVKETGNLLIHRTVLFSLNSEDSIVVEGNAVVPMIALEENLPIQAMYMDTILAYQPFIKMDIFEQESLYLWTDTLNGLFQIGHWYEQDDSLLLAYDGDSTKYHYTLVDDSLTLLDTPIEVENLWFYELHGDLEPNSLLSGWGFLEEKFQKID